MHSPPWGWQTTPPRRPGFLSHCPKMLSAICRSVVRVLRFRLRVFRAAAAARLTPPDLPISAVVLGQVRLCIQYARRSFALIVIGFPGIHASLPARTQPLDLS